MKKTITLLLFVASLVGCVKGDLVEQSENGTPREILLYQRSSASPITLSIPMNGSDEGVPLRSGDVVEPLKLLGCTYFPQNGTICEYQNIGLPIVNVEALKAAHPDYLRFLPSELLLLIAELIPFS